MISKIHSPKTTISPSPSIQLSSILIILPIICFVIVIVVLSIVFLTIKIVTFDKKLIPVISNQYENIDIMYSRTCKVSETIKPKLSEEALSNSNSACANGLLNSLISRSACVETLQSIQSCYSLQSRLDQRLHDTNHNIVNETRTCDFVFPRCVPLNSYRSSKIKCAHMHLDDPTRSDTQTHYKECNHYGTLSISTPCGSLMIPSLGSTDKGQTSLALMENKETDSENMTNTERRLPKEQIALSQHSNGLDSPLSEVEPECDTSIPSKSFNFPLRYEQRGVIAHEQDAEINEQERPVAILHLAVGFDYYDGMDAITEHDAG